MSGAADEGAAPSDDESPTDPGELDRYIYSTEYHDGWDDGWVRGFEACELDFLRHFSQRETAFQAAARSALGAADA